jgi:hypothetical protein
MIVLYLASMQKVSDLIKTSVIALVLLVSVIYYVGQSPNAPRSIETAYDFLNMAHIRILLPGY